MSAGRGSGNRKYTQLSVEDVVQLSAFMDSLNVSPVAPTTIVWLAHIKLACRELAARAQSIPGAHICLAHSVVRSRVGTGAKVEVKT